MRLQRLGEEQIYPFRSQRVFHDNATWYFDKREGTAAGPYRDPAEAKNALAVFLAQALEGLPAHQRSSIREIVGLQDNIQCLVEELMVFFQSRAALGEAAAVDWANKRIAELRKDWRIQRQKGRIDVLNYVMQSMRASVAG